MVTGLLVGLPTGLLVGPFAGLLAALPIGLLAALLAGLLGGLEAFVLHFFLRFLLSWQGDLPWHLVAFLDEVTERLLLRKVGGSYIFVHRQLLDYFAAIDDSIFSEHTSLEDKSGK